MHDQQGTKARRAKIRGSCILSCVGLCSSAALAFHTGGAGIPVGIWLVASGLHSIGGGLCLHCAVRRHD